MNAAGGQVPQDAAVNQNPFASGKQASESETPADAADAAPLEATAGDDSTGSKISPVGTLVVFCFLCIFRNSTELTTCCAALSCHSSR